MTRASRPFCLMLAGSLALAGCLPATPGGGITPPSRPVSQTPPATAPDTPASAAARAYYGQVQQALLSQGLLRTDGGGPDTPFSAEVLEQCVLKHFAKKKPEVIELNHRAFAAGRAAAAQAANAETV